MPATPLTTSDLEELYVLTLSLQNDSTALTRALDWVDSVLPIFLHACCRTVHNGPEQSLDRWHSWIESDQAQFLEEAGRGTILQWRLRWLKTLLSCARQLRCDPALRAPDARAGVAEKWWREQTGLPACFPRAFWHDLAAMLCGPPSQQQALPELAADGALDSPAFPLILAEPIVDRGTETNILLAAFHLTPVDTYPGQVFLDPQDVLLRCMDEHFAGVFQQASQAAAAAAGIPVESVPATRVRVHTLRPADERFLHGMVLCGPSGAGALALGLYALYTGNRQIPTDLAVSFALCAAADQEADGRCYPIEGADDKIRGCARSGLRRLLVSASQHGQIALYGRRQGVGVIGADTFAAAAQEALPAAAMPSGPVADNAGATLSDPATVPEIAHVLIMDIVGYSLLKLPEQVLQLEALQQTVRQTGEFQKAEASGDFICFPTGDGMALVFFRNPVAPVHCALEIAQALRLLPSIRLRMGVHSGLVYRVKDINTHWSVSGEGINMAQRVMDCGDAGHILLSRKVAENLEHIGGWTSSLQELGECEVKHGARLHLYNLVHQGLGNPTSPEKIGSLRVAILYRRSAQPDGHVLRLLETELKQKGYRVFVDRHIGVGVEWAAEIERQVRSADAVIVLLSAAAMQSEMLAYEVGIANEAAQHRGGKPRILPVRIAYEGALSAELAGILDPIQHTLWKNPEEDAQLVQQIVQALKNPEAQRALAVREQLEPVGGAVPLDSKFWIVRPVEGEFREAIARRDSIVLVKGARQMGKTSILARGLQQARQAGSRCIHIDFQKLNAGHLETIESFYMALGGLMADQLDLEVMPEEVWNPRRGANVNFERYVRRQMLENLGQPLVWAMDEVDRLFTCDFGSEVFGLFRSWHNERSLDPDGPWSRLTLAIAYATEAHLFITDMNQSPFNIGTQLPLDDFTLSQVADLNARYASPLKDEEQISRFYRLVGGQPYLVQKGLNEMAGHGVDIQAFEEQAGRDEGLFGDHLRRYLVLLVRDPDLCNVLRGALKGQACPTAESFYRLRSAGLLAGHSQLDARLRCQIYENYLRRHLL